MTIEIRACRDESELKQYGSVVGYVFAINEAEDLERELAITRPEWTTCAFDDGQLVSSLATIPFVVRLNGAPIRMGGVTAVGTLPEYRRKGLLRQTMVQALHEMREREQPFAILWASMGAIYQRFGYGLATPCIQYEFDPRRAALRPGNEVPGRVTLLPEDDGKALAQTIYGRFIQPRNMLLERNDFMWEMGPFKAKKKPLYIAAYYDLDDRPRGYLVYQTRDNEQWSTEPPPQVLEVKDIAWETLDSYRGLWEYIRSHDLVGKVHMRSQVGEDDPMPALLLEPRLLNKATVDGVWMRITDVVKAVEARPYRGKASLRVAVVDDLLPWNDGTWRLDVEGGRATLCRDSGAVDLTMPIASLASLLSGHRTATASRLAGLLEGDDDAVRMADAVFATEYAPYMAEEF